MASKAFLSLIFIAYCVIIIYAENENQCPNEFFLQKHVREHLEDENAAEKAAREAALLIRKPNKKPNKNPITIQTFIIIPNRKSPDLWETYTREGTNKVKKTMCQTKLKYRKVDCKLGIYKCGIKGVGFARHTLTNKQTTCPDPLYVQKYMCPTCKDAKTVAEFKDKTIDEDWAFHWKPSIIETVFIPKNGDKLSSLDWKPVGNNECELKEAASEYGCENKGWICDMKNFEESQALHDLSMDGHFIR